MASFINLKSILIFTVVIATTIKTILAHGSSISPYVGFGYNPIVSPFYGYGLANALGFGFGMFFYIHFKILYYLMRVNFAKRLCQLLWKAM
ncbi:hypothetical protein BLA29_010857, partial [Euroglyphus maynei]